MKTLDLSRSVYDLTSDHPELVDVLVGLGFSPLADPAMREAAGRTMTIPRGAVAHGIDMGSVVTALVRSGYALAGTMPQGVAESTDAADGEQGAVERVVPAPSRTEQIKGYLGRLSAGEDLATVRAEFVAEFQDVDASEIMGAEQELMDEGTPLEEVQRLCDVHSALFHDTTCGEGNAAAIASAEAAVEAILARRGEAPAAEGMPSKPAAPTGPGQVVGHPLHTLTRENDAALELLGRLDAALDAAEEGDEDVRALVSRLRGIVTHYAKKGDLLYPLLKVTYGIDGPQNVMWTVDDEIRDELGRLVREPEVDQAWIMAAGRVATRVREMVYKEANILFPLCVRHFSQDEWVGIYRDGQDYDVCLGVVPAAWDEGGRALAAAEPATQAGAGEVVMPGGHLTIDQLTALLNTLPVEVSFVDHENINRYFNEGPKAFKRPRAALDREVFSCHPPKVEGMVRTIIESFRAGTLDQVPVWMEKGGRPMLVTYMAVRDRDGSYLGTAEFVQDMSLAREHFQR